MVGGLCGDAALGACPPGFQDKNGGIPRGHFSKALPEPTETWRAAPGDDGISCLWTPFPVLCFLYGKAVRFAPRPLPPDVEAEDRICA
jgi:hypothetical protein